MKAVGHGLRKDNKCICDVSVPGRRPRGRPERLRDAEREDQTEAEDPSDGERPQVGLICSVIFRYFRKCIHAGLLTPAETVPLHPCALAKQGREVTSPKRGSNRRSIPFKRTTWNKLASFQSSSIGRSKLWATVTETPAPTFPT